VFEDLLQETDITGSHYLEMADKDLVRQAQAEDTKALVTMLERYGEFVRLKGRSYFLVGADREDIIQEGMIGLYKAIRDYREDRETSFKAFAEICITRQIITAIKTATRQKHSPLNSYVSLNNPISEADDPDRLYMDFLASDSTLDPAEVVISHADGLDRHVKSIDNALQRIKRKVEQHLQYRENLARGILPKGHDRRSSSQPA
jgi:RNA polymerase sporulation-specific sigma factor